MAGAALTLPGLVQFEPPLFEERALRSYLDSRRDGSLDKVADELRLWLSDLKSASGTENEQNLEQSFNSRILTRLLGYQSYPSDPSTFWPKPPADVTNLNGTPDVVLGSFTQASREFVAIVEIKRPGTDLDKPQSRKGALTPVQQAFSYASKLLGVRWVIVTDMKQIRLYSVESAFMYDSISLQECVFQNGRPALALQKFRFLLHADSLTAPFRTQSLVESLLAKSASRKRDIEAGFYQTYYEIRKDLLHEITVAANDAGVAATFSELLGSTQRLLDRVIFTNYCEQHPAQLLPNGTLRNVISSAQNLPSVSSDRVYEFVKALFREIDIGSSAASGLHLTGYNGELFKEHPIIDRIRLPDYLASKPYTVRLRDGTKRTIRGVWGFDAYDFWRELDEHLLGSLFEQSLSDIVKISRAENLEIAQRSARRRHGIFYTDDILSEFTVDGAVSSLLPIAPENDESNSLQVALNSSERLRALRIIDPACGSGAFLVSAYRRLSAESYRIAEVLAGDTSSPKSQQLGLDLEAQRSSEAVLLRSTLFGVDLLPQATEIAKLALWLRSARKAEKVADLGRNIVAADSLHLDELVEIFGREVQSQFDLVLGNPPWGGEIASDALLSLRARFDVPDGMVLDTWEWFLLLAVGLLRADGVLAMILPDTLFAPRKVWIRNFLATQMAIEKVANLGMRWFTDRVRMGTCIVQARKSNPLPLHTFTGFSLTGETRTAAIEGRILLSQAEADRGKQISQASIVLRPDRAIHLGRGTHDEEIEGRMQSASIRFDAMCEGRRGEEFSNYGLHWRCPGCGTHSVPPDSRRDRASKDCPGCGARLTRDLVDEVFVISTQPGTGSVPLVDTEDIHERHSLAQPTRFLKLGLSGVSYKSEQIYQGPKILVREAGIGITAALDTTNARCVRTLYSYRLRDRFVKSGLQPEYVLAALQSRTMHYYIVLITNQGDPRRPLANLRMETIAQLPIPAIFDVESKKLHDEVVEVMRRRMSIPNEVSVTVDDDLRIEQILRRLWNLSGDDGLYIARELRKLPQYGLLAQMEGLHRVDVRRARLRRRSSRAPAFSVGPS